MYGTAPNESRKFTFWTFWTRYHLMPEGLFYGPRRYQPSHSKKRLSALKNSLQVACHITSKSQATYTSLLWHDNLNSRNSFVNSEDPTCIIIIGNRQSTSAYIIMQIGYSELIITTVQSLRIWKDLFTTKTWCLRSR